MEQRDLRGAELISCEEMIIKGAGFRGTVLSGHGLFLEESDSRPHSGITHVIAWHIDLDSLHVFVYWSRECSVFDI